MTQRILIVEDHELLAQSLVFALRADGFDVHEVPALDADTILKTASELEPDVVLLDFDLGEPLGTSVALIEPLRQGGAAVVMLTGITDRVRHAECVEAGAIGVVSKSEPFERLIEAVKGAVEHGTLLSAAERDDLLAELRRHRAADRERMQAFTHLTRREQEVLGALMDGRSADQIAKDFVVSTATVRSQIRAILQKLGVHSQLEATALARKAGWRPGGD